MAVSIGTVRRPLSQDFAISRYYLIRKYQNMYQIREECYLQINIVMRLVLFPGISFI